MDDACKNMGLRYFSRVKIKWLFKTILEAQVGSCGFLLLRFLHLS